MPTVELTHFAGRAGDRNDRGMTGSRLVAAAFATRLGVDPVVVGAPQPAMGRDWAEELESARPELEAMSARFDEIFTAGARPVTALSRCAVAIATLPVVARHRPDAVVVWFDAHADINTPESSTTGYLGGIALSGPMGLWDSGLGAGLAESNVVLVGTRDLDDAEQALVDTGRVALVGPGPDLPERLRQAIAGRPVYVHIDCDVLDPHIVPTEYLVEHGLTLDDLRAAALVMAESEVLGLELGELEAGADDGVDIVAPLLDAIAPVLDSL